MYEELYEKIANQLVETGYIILEQEMLELAKALLAKKGDIANFKNAGISKQINIDTFRRRDKIAWLNKDGGAQSEFLSFAKGLQEYLNRALFLGLRYYEAHFATYEKGDFYETHLDAFRGAKNRVVTTVFYLNEDWKEDDGGELCIYDENQELLRKLLPTQGTLVVFLSEKFPHEVLPANKKRHSIAGWFRVDKLPTF